MSSISPRHFRDKLKLKPQTVTLAKGLKTWPEVYKAASHKAKRDFRGIKYDIKTGKAILT